MAKKSPASKGAKDVKTTGAPTRKKRLRTGKPVRLDLNEKDHERLDRIHYGHWRTLRPGIAERRPVRIATRRIWQRVA